MPDEVLLDVISEHAEEAAFLWQLRQYAVVAPHFSLPRLWDLDDRLEAHLDGLRIAGVYGWEACLQSLDRNAPGEVFAAAMLAFGSGEPARIPKVTAAASQSRELSRGLSSALAWLGDDVGAKGADTLLASDSQILRRAGLAVYAIMRQNAPQLPDLLRSQDNPLRARALRNVGELGRLDLWHAVRSNLEHTDRECRFWAAWSGTLLGELPPRLVLEQFVKSADPLGDAAVCLLMAVLPADAAERLYQDLALTPALVRRSILAAGALGNVEAVDRLIRHMASSPLARTAAESFTIITGIRIVGDLEGAQPGDFIPTPSDSPEDDSVEMDPDEDLPFPAVDALVEHWRKIKPSLPSQGRLILGKPADRSWLEQVLRHGFQRERLLAAWKLAASSGGVLFETRAPAFRQCVALGEELRIE